MNSNAFALLAAFDVQAQKEGWTKEEIKTVTDEARSGDYDHLLVTLSNHCDPVDEPTESNDNREDEEWLGSTTVW